MTETEILTFTLEKDGEEKYMAALDTCIEYYKDNNQMLFQSFLSTITMWVTFMVAILSLSFILVRDYVVSVLTLLALLVIGIFLPQKLQKFEYFIPKWYRNNADGIMFIVSKLNALYLAKLEPERWNLKVEIDRSKKIISANTELNK